MLINVWDDNTLMVSRLDISQKNPVMQNRPNTSKHPALHSAVGLNREVDRFVMETWQCGILHTFDIAHISWLTHQIQNVRISMCYVWLLPRFSPSKKEWQNFLIFRYSAPNGGVPIKRNHPPTGQSCYMPTLIISLFSLVVIKQYQTINAFLVFTGNIWIICHW